MAENHPSDAGDAGLIPAQGTKIPYATGQLSPRALQLLSLCASTESPRRKLQSPRAVEPACYNWREVRAATKILRAATKT